MTDNASIFFSKIYDDFLDDHLNADHAWIEAVFVNFHSKEPTPFHTESTKASQDDAFIETVSRLY